jgi:DNA repair photolyase
MGEQGKPTPKGRGSPINPPKRFEKTHRETDWEQIEHDEEYLAALSRPKTEYLPDKSKSIISENDSPDIPFRFSLNPYRGCSHGCSYCYARPTHEYLGLSAGLDFETKIFVKHDAAKLFRQFLSRPKWTPEPIVLSGVTDPYQPAERDFQITRQCLEVALEARQPMDIITKNALIGRDLDLLREMAALRIVRAFVSVTTLDAELARTMEPRTSTPTARLTAIRTLADAGVPVQVMVAPIVPGLNDSEIPAILAAAADAGAKAAGYVMLRLPLAVGPIFMAWIDQHRPTAKKRIENAIRATRAGALNSSAFGERMKGQGLMAEQVAKLFRTFAKRLGLDRTLAPTARDLFRRPGLTPGQNWLF